MIVGVGDQVECLLLGSVARESMLDDLRFSLEKLVQYSAALLMFYQADILPTNNGVTHSLLEYHEQRRVVVEEALQRCDVVPEDVKKVSLGRE